MNLYEKIQAVSNAVKNIEKNMQIGTGNYKYKAVQDRDVIFAINPAETENKLVSIPIKQELINSEVIRTMKEGKETLTFVDTIKMTTRIIDLEDTTQFIDIESFGKGVDSGDKGFGKASTYARKIALLNAYKIATGEDPDAEKSKEIESQKLITEKRKKVTDYANMDSKTVENLCNYYKVSSLDKLTDEQISVIYVTYEKRRLI